MHIRTREFIILMLRGHNCRAAKSGRVYHASFSYRSILSKSQAAHTYLLYVIEGVEAREMGRKTETLFSFRRCDGDAAHDRPALTINITRDFSFY